jgi:pimeloyl-ACP methyl ester carboxylesterase
LAAVGSGPESGPVVVLAHGWTADHRVWGPTATRLVAAGRRVVMYDQRGHGASTVGRAGLTIDGLADDLRTVLEYLDARDAVLAGHSMGGMAVQAFALRHPDVLADRVASLVLVSTAADRVAGPGPYRTWAPWLVGRTRVTRAVGSRWAGPFLVRHAVGRRACLAHLAATAETFAATPPSVRAELLSAIVDLDLTGGLTTITTPTVVVSGTRDRLTVHRRSRTIAALIPGARLEVLRGAGHQLVFEAPDRLAELIGGPRPVPAPAGAMP